MYIVCAILFISIQNFICKQKSFVQKINFNTAGWFVAY